MSEIAIVLFGRAGSGKGSLAQQLTMRHGHRHLSTGQAMREWAAGPRPEQRALKAGLARGEYGSDGLAAQIVREFLAATLEPVILDGFPRNPAQLSAWRAVDRTSDRALGIFLDTPVAVCRGRLSERRTCAACGWTDRRLEICPRCGGRLAPRADDADPTAIAKRLADFTTMVVPVLEAWRASGLALQTLVIGEGDAAVSQAADAIAEMTLAA